MDINIKHLLLLSLLAAIPWVGQASRPEPAKDILAVTAEARYSDHVFVGFKTRCISTEIEMHKIWDEFYNRYMEPYFAGILAENDTIFVISQYNSGRTESIYITFSDRNFGIVLEDSTYLIVEEVPGYTDGYKLNDKSRVVDDLVLFFEEHFSLSDTKWWQEQAILTNTIFGWDAAKIINMFCSSEVFGSIADNHSMNIYRVIKKGDKVTEYTSISCNAKTYWDRRMWLSTDKFDPYMRRRHKNKGIVPMLQEHPPISIENKTPLR